MSVLMEQHQAGVDARSRLGMPMMSKPRMRMDLIRRPGRRRAVDEVPVNLIPNFAPFNFYQPPSPYALIRYVAVKRGIKYHDIIGSSRIHPFVAARREAVTLVVEHCRPKTLHELGRIFHRDHSSILNLLGRRKKQVRVNNKVSPTIHTNHSNMNETRLAE